MATRSTANAEQVNFAFPAPHPGQIKVLQSLKRFNVLVCGRRWRKTSLLSAIAVERYATRSKTFLWTAPTFSTAMIGWDEVTKSCGQAIRVGYVIQNKSEMMMHFHGGGKIIFRSLEDPDNARGYTADGVGIDEFPFCPERAWTAVLRAMLMDTGGEGYFLGTPNGKNWGYQEFMLQQLNPIGFAIQCPTVGCDIVDGRLVRVPNPYENPFVRWEEIEDMFSRMPERIFRQEVMAEFMDDAGGVFRGVKNAVCKGKTQNVAPRKGRVYKAGCDIARIHDFTVISIVDVETLEQVYRERFNQVSWPRIYGAIENACKLYNNCSVNIDATGMGEHVPDELRRRGLGVNAVKFTSANKQLMVDHLASQIERCRKPFLLDDMQQTMELETYQYTKTPSGNTRMGAPEGDGYYDDYVMADVLAYDKLRFFDGSESYMLPVTWYTDIEAVNRQRFGDLW